MDVVSFNVAISRQRPFDHNLGFATVDNVGDLEDGLHVAENCPSDESHNGRPNFGYYFGPVDVDQVRALTQMT